MSLRKWETENNEYIFINKCVYNNSNGKQNDIYIIFLFQMKTMKSEYKVLLIAVARLKLRLAGATKTTF